MGKKSAPPTPDYAAAAQQQASANLEATRAQSWFNNPNITSPTGTRTVSANPNQPDQFNVNETLNPAEQSLHDSSNTLQQQIMAALSGSGLPAVSSAMNSSYSLPGSAQTKWEQQYLPTVARQYDQELGQSPDLKGKLDFSGAPAMPQANAGVRDQVINSIYGQGAKLLDRQYANKNTALATALSNQGIFRGGTDGAPAGNTAFANAHQDLNTQEQSAYGDLMDRSIQRGGDAMKQLFDMGMSARQEGVGETTTAGQFQNAARGQELQSMLSAMLGHNNAVGDAYNTANASSALANSGRAQNFTEMSAAHTMPVNILTALLGANQVNAPQFQPYAGGNVVQPAPIMQAAQLTGQSALNTQNVSSAQTGQFAGLAGTLGMAAAIF